MESHGSSELNSCLVIMQGSGLHAAIPSSFSSWKYSYLNCCFEGFPGGQWLRSTLQCRRYRSIPGWGIRSHDLEQLSLPTTAREPVIPSAATKTQHSQIKKKKNCCFEILYSFKLITIQNVKGLLCGENRSEAGGLAPGLPVGGLCCRECWGWTGREKQEEAMLRENFA